ncbi:MAG: MBL fold metallo-hydrolase [Thermodesulfobacteriota bacterium]|jgi:ribonuclease BN (tRNA processing enzyme)|nr:MAG: MBL fold metallo-hydrolase [Thermodesulfobacteriota bacterium]
MEKFFTVTFLGTGTGVPLKNRQAPGLVVQAGDTRLLLDSGSGTAYQLARAGFHYYQFDHLLYSHFAHPDHINDLAELIFANSYFDPVRKTTISVYGPKGIKNFLKNLFVLYPVLGNPPYPITVHELEQDTNSVNDVIMETKPLNHQQSPCLGYRIHYQGKSIIYSGDTDYCDALVTLAHKGDLLIVECSFPDGYKMDGHITPTEVGQIATQAQVKKVVLTHLYPPCEQVDVVSQVKEHFGGEVIRAEDLMQISI